MFCLFADNDDDDLSRISRSLHVILNGIVGSEEEVLIRRTATNLRDKINRVGRRLANGQTVPIYSGSKAEGLRFKSSDEDWMHVYKGIKVIPSDQYASLYDSNTNLLLTMENAMTKPGFTLLRKVEDNRCAIYNTNGESPIVPMLNGLYMSSSIWREQYTTVYPALRVLSHGPCASYEICGTEVDDAYCLESDVWPTIARSSILRLNQSSWPRSNIIRSIVSDGVLFVPIGAKLSTFENVEWRMSFSLAEKRLIHSMNHTQLLCYALLKLFLKEVIDTNEEIKGLLCSYFMKSALFWEITSSPNPWNPSSLLSCFWKCFRRILQWLSCSYCPNFFIPESNMFEGKIEGENRWKLLQYLTYLHQEGFRCLLRFSSFTTRPSIADVLNGKGIIAEKPTCKTCIALATLSEGKNSCPLGEIGRGLNKEIACLKLYQFLQTSGSGLEQFFIRTWLHKSLTQICVVRSRQALFYQGSNISCYKDYVQSMKVLDECRQDSACHYLYQAMTCYNAGKYGLTIKLAQRAKKAIFSQGSICLLELDSSLHDKFREAGSELLPIETVMKNCGIGLLSFLTIPEFLIETLGSKEAGFGNNHKLPPAICALFLQHLCYNKLGQIRERDESLYELSLIIKHDPNYSCEEHVHSMSWQILGICQQTNGDDWAAFRSYRMALYYATDCCKATTCFRFGTLLAKYIW